MESSQAKPRKRSTRRWLLACALVCAVMLVVIAVMTRGFGLVGESVHVYSAGTNPGEGINALSAASLAEVGIDISTETPKAIDPALVCGFRHYAGPRSPCR
jgi:hypothetical protein